MALSQADEARLVSLQQALDDLLSGARVAKVSSGGRSVDYAPAEIDALRREIADLKAQSAGPGLRGPIRFRFR